MIRALSPQAKGRIERCFGTLQDRLLREMRVARIDSLDSANRFLDEHFLPFWNDRFTVRPADPVDAHRPLPEGTDLQRLFAEEEQRAIGADFTFRYKNCFYQIIEAEADAAMPKTKITIERRLDGSTHFRWRSRYLQPLELGRTKPRPTLETKAVRDPKPKPTPPQPTANHPWKRYPVRCGKNDPMRRVPR